MSTALTFDGPAARVRYYLGSLALWTLTLGFGFFILMIIVPAC